jgi:hypothetical protein
LPGRDGNAGVGAPTFGAMHRMWWCGSCGDVGMFVGWMSGCGDGGTTEYDMTECGCQLMWAF